MSADRGPAWLALSSPGPDRPLVPTVERVGRQLRAVASTLSDEIHLDFHDLYAPKRNGLGFVVEPADHSLRSAWALIAESLVAFAVGAHDGRWSLAETHDWFWDGADTKPLGTVGRRSMFSAIQASPQEIRALLPYLLDPSAVATRRGVNGRSMRPEDRLDRKKSGVYYTPGDVAVHMASKLLAPELAVPTSWIDPAQGSGVFLRAILALASEKFDVRDHLYGIDIDPFAAEATAFVLTVEDLMMFPRAGAPYELWHRYRKNLVTGNSMFLMPSQTTIKRADPLWRIADVFPEVAGEGFSRVIANPPYAKRPQHPSNELLADLHPVTGSSSVADISPMFLEIGVNLLSPDGAATFVMPLSAMVSTRAPFPQLRVHLAETDGKVSFEAFDRVPDALFGDDIKTRNSVITITRGVGSGFTTTPLHRWTSRQRKSAFTKLPSVSVSEISGAPELLPKIGTAWEKDLYIICNEWQTKVSGWVTSRRSVPLAQMQHVDDPHWSKMIAVAPTAYNFLGLTRDATQAALDGHDSENAVALLSFESARHAGASYALLASRLGFWLWHVNGDGFHTSAKLPSYVPAPLGRSAIERLADLGETLWKEVRQNPLKSRNRGKTTVSYPTWIFSDILGSIDREVDAMLGTDFANQLATWHERLVVVDSSASRTEIVMRKIK